MSIRPGANGSYSATKVPVLALLTFAFGVSPDRVSGAPASTKRYDIEARFERDDASLQVPTADLLIRAVLRERFGLVAHIEPRDLPVYVLKVARRDGRLGVGLKPSSVNCHDEVAASEARQRSSRATNGAPACGAIEDPERFVAGGTTIETLARALRIPSGRTVIDGTGLAGTWDVTLEFSPLNESSAARPSIFTVVEGQLGLTLQPSTAPLDVLVVDSIYEPTPN